MESAKHTDNTAVAVGFLAGKPGPGPAWLQTLRQSAQAKLADFGFPKSDDEEWRFTKISPLLEWPLHAPSTDSQKITAEDIKPFRLASDGYCLVFVDGKFEEELSTLPPAGAPFRCASLASHWDTSGAELEKTLARATQADGNYFSALNTASFEDGAYISIPAGVAVEEPIQILYLAASEKTGASIHARNLIVAHQSSSAKIIESYASLTESPHFTNSVTELILDPNAKIEHCRVENENEHAYHVAWIQGILSRDSYWLSHSIVMGGRLVRNQIQALLNSESCQAVLNGLYMGSGEQLIDHHTVVDHSKPRCESHEYYFGILGGRARGVFNGKIFVRQDAQKTNAKQTNRNLVLSDTALIDTKPQLEIYADDVKCTHGATIGQLNQDALFYLQARGVGAEMARRMLVRAFANDAVERITIDSAREYLENLLTQRFQGLEIPAAHGR